MASHQTSSYSTAHSKLDHRQRWVPIFALRVVGYILILLAILDAIDSLVPPDFFNPAWEFATIGRFVDRSPVALIGLGLAFYQGKRLRRPLERLLLKPLASLAILAGVLYCLTIPLTLGDGMRLQEQAIAKAKQDQVQQTARLKTLETSIRQASLAQLQRLATTIDAQDLTDLPKTETRLRTELLSRLQIARDTAVRQSLTAGDKQRFVLRKTVIKWVLGALLSGIGFIYLGYVAWRTF